MRRAKDEGVGPRPDPKRLAARGPVREAWGDRYGFTPDEVDRIVTLGRKCGRTNTHAVNGDAHPRVRGREDKNANAAAWERELDAAAAKLTAIVGPKGFRVVFYGLFPSLERAGGGLASVPREASSIYIPYDAP